MVTLGSQYPCFQERQSLQRRLHILTGTYFHLFCAGCDVFSRVHTRGNKSQSRSTPPGLVGPLQARSLTPTAHPTLNLSAATPSPLPSPTARVQQLQLRSSSSSSSTPSWCSQSTCLTRNSCPPPRSPSQTTFLPPSPPLPESTPVPHHPAAPHTPLRACLLPPSLSLPAAWLWTTCSQWVTTPECLRQPWRGWRPSQTAPAQTVRNARLTDARCSAALPATS